MVESALRNVCEMTKKNGSSFEEWRDELRWFMGNHQRLARRYDGQNVCVYRHRVVDHDEDLERLMRRIERIFPTDRVLVEFVSRKKLEFSWISLSAWRSVVEGGHLLCAALPSSPSAFLGPSSGIA